MQRVCHPAVIRASDGQTLRGVGNDFSIPAGSGRSDSAVSATKLSIQRQVGRALRRLASGVRLIVGVCVMLLAKVLDRSASLWCGLVEDIPIGKLVAAFLNSLV